MKKVNALTGKERMVFPRMQEEEGRDMRTHHPFSCPHTAVRLDSSSRFMHADGMAREDWKRLASYVVARRVALGYKNRRALANVLNVSWRTLSSLEAGQPVGANTLGMVENALLWRPGSAQDVLSGSEPALLDSVKDPAGPELRDDVERQLWEIKGLSDDEKRGFIAYHRALIEQEREAAIRRTG